MSTFVFPIKKASAAKSAKAKERDPKLKGALSRFNAAFEQLNDILVERSSEITALKFCVMTKEHLMLEGDPGVAKSKLSKEAALRITGSKFYRKQFMENTQVDEVFGCMDSKRYREKAEWHYNVTGMLPDCHIANLDEIYRASAALLPSMMGILNEREFHNGTDLIKCPLITAIGTTNFTTVDEKLDAFHDRWLIKAKVQPLSSKTSRITVIERFLNELSGLHRDEVKTVSLQDIQLIHAHLNTVQVSHEVVALYEELLRKYAAIEKGVRISDRRYCQVMKLVIAAYLMDENRSDVLDEKYLSAVQYGVCVLNDQGHIDSFSRVFDEVIGQRMKDIEMSRKLIKLEQKVSEMESEYDDNMPAAESKHLYQQVSRYLFALSGDTSTIRLDANNRAKVDAMINTLTVLKTSLDAQVDAALAEEAADEVDLVD